MSSPSPPFFANLVLIGEASRHSALALNGTQLPGQPDEMGRKAAELPLL
jgi:hypothetical protein